MAWMRGALSRFIDFSSAAGIRISQGISIYAVASFSDPTLEPAPGKPNSVPANAARRRRGPSACFQKGNMAVIVLFETFLFVDVMIGGEMAKLDCN